MYKLGIAVILVFTVGMFVNLNADVTVLSLDTSGSMKLHGFEEAKAAILKTLREIQGPVLIVGFDVNDYEIWRGTVREENRSGVIEAVTQKLSALSPDGAYTHMEEALDCGKVFLLSTPESGQRKLILFSDGINRPAEDVDQYHKPVDLSLIAERIIPQNLGFSVYFIGLAEDLEGFFGNQADSTGLISNAQYPHVKGVPLNDYDPSSVEKAFTRAVDDTPEHAIKPADSNESTENVASWFKRNWLLVALGFLGVIFVVFLAHGKKDRIEVNEDSNVTAVADYDDLYEDTLQLIVQGADVPPLSYPLDEGTVYMLGVDIPVPYLDYGVAQIKMKKRLVTIEPLTTGFTKNGVEFNGETIFASGDTVQFRHITLALTMCQQEEEMLAVSSAIHQGTEVNKQNDLTDDDLNLF